MSPVFPGTSVPGFHMPPLRGWGLLSCGVRPFPAEFSSDKYCIFICLRLLLFIAQAFDGIELGGAGGGDGAENYSYHRRNDEGDDGG